MNPNFDLILDYIRMVSYAVVVLTSLRGILRREFTNLLFVGDIIIATSFFVSLFRANILGFVLSKEVDLLVTPAAVIWATIHFVLMLKESKSLK